MPKIYRTIFRLIVVVLFIGYLVYAFKDLTGKGDRSVCQKINIKIANDTCGFVNPNEIIATLQENQIYPIGKTMDSISSNVIATTLRENPYISDIVCYKSPGGNVNILIDQYIPIMRVIPDSGSSFYLDQTGICLPTRDYVGNFLVATGDIDTAYASKELIKLAQFVRNNEFWNQQLEQVHVNPNKKVDLYPRVGKQIIRMGRIEDIETKFENLKLFYDKVMPVVGWNKYYELNIAFTNQVIGKKHIKKKWPHFWMPQRQPPQRTIPLTEHYKHTHKPWQI